MIRPDKVIFIDRDGVVNRDPGGWTEHSYVTRWEDFHFLEGALRALALFKRSGFRVVIISNQAGVGKGFFTKEDLDKVNSKMLAEVRKHGGAIDGVYYCVHRKEDGCSCRKPKTGMFEAAVKRYGVMPRETYFIGDSLVDIAAGAKMGMETVFVLSGKTSLEESRGWGLKPGHVFKDLLEAARWITAKEKRRAERALKRKMHNKGGGR
jgi:histidinol-phosphate phosphatase family protein